MANINLLGPAAKINRYRVLAIIAMILALCVIMLGAYTRLTDAGLGCPDWPGCYGKMVLTHHQVALVQSEKPTLGQTIVLHKAWTEMAHRYLASLLGLLIIILAIISIVRRRYDKSQLLWAPLLLVLMLLGQALLGMWTVTLLLLPLVVMSHLLGGMIIAGLLCWIVNASKRPQKMDNYRLNSLRIWAILGIMILLLQIFLGAWTSTNYAALACPDFPYCQGALWPNMNWHDGFNFASPIGPDYEGGRLAMNARVTIHMAHRIGALISAVYLFLFSLSLLIIPEFSALRKLGGLLTGLLIVQVILGISNVVLMLPLAIAVLHNGVAALLLLTMVTILYRLYMTDKQRWTR